MGYYPPPPHQIESLIHHFSSMYTYFCTILKTDVSIRIMIFSSFNKSLDPSSQVSCLSERCNENQFQSMHVKNKSCLFASCWLILVFSREVIVLGVPTNKKWYLNCIWFQYWKNDQVCSKKGSKCYVIQKIEIWTNCLISSRQF